MSIGYPIRTASKLTGLTIDTLRAWERRYEAVVPARSERGRVYSEEQIQRLVRLRQAVNLGYAIGEVARLETRELDHLLETLPETPRTFSRALESNPSVILESLLDSIDSFDFIGTERRLVRLATLLEPREFALQVILPLMRVVGARWHEGRCSVAQEHMVSATLRNVIGSVIRTGAIRENGPRVLMATPSSELHEFGILAAALLASSHGFAILYLGPNLPAHEIVDSADRLRASVVLLGISNPTAGLETREEVRLVASVLSPEVHLWIGGSPARFVTASLDRARLLALPDFEDLDRALSEFRP